MLRQRFNNEQEVTEWYKSNVENQPVIVEFGEFDMPDMYPCVMVYNMIEHPYCDNHYDDEQMAKLKKDGYCSDEIVKFIFYYTYPTDFE